jgi:hypothetical protein
MLPPLDESRRVEHPAALGIGDRPGGTGLIAGAIGVSSRTISAIAGTCVCATNIWTEGRKKTAGLLHCLLREIQEWMAIHGDPAPCESIWNAGDLPAHCKHRDGVVRFQDRHSSGEIPAAGSDRLAGSTRYRFALTTAQAPRCCVPSTRSGRAPRDGKLDVLEVATRNLRVPHARRRRQLDADHEGPAPAGFAAFQRQEVIVPPVWRLSAMSQLGGQRSP